MTVASPREARWCSTSRRAPSRSAPRPTLKARAYGLAFTPDDRFAVFFERSTVTVWDMERHVIAAMAKVRSAVGLAMSPRGDTSALVWSVAEALAG